MDLTTSPLGEKKRTKEMKSTEVAFAVKGTMTQAIQLEHQRVIENLRTQ